MNWTEHISLIAAFGAVFAAGGLWVKVSQVKDLLAEVKLDMHGDRGLVARVESLENWRAEHTQVSADKLRRIGHLEEHERGTK